MEALKEIVLLVDENTDVERNDFSRRCWWTQSDWNGMFINASEMEKDERYSIQRFTFFERRSC